MDYFEKLEHNPYEDLMWNISEQKQGTVNVIGGNEGNFRTEIKVAEFLSGKYPLKSVDLVLPDSLKNKLPPLSNFVFMPSTDAGTFDDSQALHNVFNAADFNLVLGDFSKNRVTVKAIASAIESTEKMTFVTRDSVDLITERNPDKTLMNEELIIFASIAQLVKLLRAVYYPKVLLLSQSLVQVAEVLHKFTLSYPVSIITFHSGQILIAGNGIVKAVSIEKTDFTPLTIWSGELAGKIVALNLYNPNQFIKASVSALFK